MGDSTCNSRDNLSQHHNKEDDDVIIEHKHTGGTYKLRDSRYKNTNLCARLCGFFSLLFVFSFTCMTIFFIFW